MESAIRGLVLDSNVLVAAERAKLTTPEVLRNIRASAAIGDAPIVISAMTVAELAHGIQRCADVEVAGGAARGLRVAWLGLCAYTWYAPAHFRRMLARALGTVRLDPRF